MVTAGSDFHAPGGLIRTGHVPCGSRGPAGHVAAFRQAFFAIPNVIPKPRGQIGQFFQIHPENPQPRLVKRAVEIVRQGGVIVYPTDSSYARKVAASAKRPRWIRRIRQLDDKHNFTLVCRDLSELGSMPRSTPACSACSRRTPVPTPSSSAPPARCRACSCTPKRRTIRPARAELSDRPGAAGGTGRTADEREPDHARQRRAAERSLCARYWNTRST